MDLVLYKAVYRFFVVSNTFVEWLRFDKKGNHNIIMVFKYGSFIRLCVFILFRSP